MRNLNLYSDFYNSVETGKYVKYLLFILLLILPKPGFSQSLTGIVIDDTTKEELSYVNISIVGKNKGFISYLNGEFSIDLNVEHLRDTLKFSYVGYKSHMVPISSIDFKEKQIVKLTPEEYVLNPIEVSANSSTLQLGSNKAGRTYTGWGDFESSKGRMRGLIIEGAECPVKLKSFSFRINHNDWDSIRFRLNFRKIGEDMKPEESLLTSNIFITTSLKHKWIKTDLDAYNILICNRVLVTLEWVDAWGTTGKFSNLLTLSNGKSQGYTLSQEIGEDFATISEGLLPAIFLEVYDD